MRKFDYEMHGAGRMPKRGGAVVLMLMFSFCCMMTADALAAGGSDASKCIFKVQKKSGNRQRVAGGYSTMLKISEVYEAEIRWRGEEPAQLSVETVYMVSEERRSFPYGSTTYAVVMSPNSTTNLVLETPEFVKRDYAYGSSYGIRLEGIIARLMKDGEVLKVYTSRNDSNWKKLANEKVVKTRGASNPYGYASENPQSRLLRIRAGEVAPPGSAQTDMSPAAFIVDRPNKLVAFSAMASLSNDYYGDFYGMDSHYYCVSLVLRKQGTAAGTSYYYDGSGSANRYVRAYVSRETALGRQVRNVLSDGNRHDVNVNLHFPPARTGNSSYSGSSTPCCFLDMMETNAVATVSSDGGNRSTVKIGANERFSRSSGMDASRRAETASAPDADSSYEVDSFCGYKFGCDYRRPNWSNGYSSMSPDVVKVRLERPFRNFKAATLTHGKAGLQSVLLHYYDEMHAMKDEDLDAEVAAVKGILEKKYGIKFDNSTAQRGKMFFAVHKSGSGIRLEVTNRAVARRGQNFGADGGADVL